ncbi:hypothetical protein JZ751_017885 [Albula glossodonta]|uniref:Uncharacterized protein n=1 Tax=Albula glossodonta TaxID=121402 RepID=A0A8T2PPQ2_9TELE|nr:hypothetical protein JZ751_017885 [Albula glossodonta]
MDFKGTFKLSNQDELGDVTDVKTPDNATATERRHGRLAAESAKFDPDHYLADLFEDDAAKVIRDRVVAGSRARGVNSLLILLNLQPRTTLLAAVAPY